MLHIASKGYHRTGILETLKLQTHKKRHEVCWRENSRMTGQPFFQMCINSVVTKNLLTFTLCKVTLEAIWISRNIRTFWSLEKLKLNKTGGVQPGFFGQSQCKKTVEECVSTACVLSSGIEMRILLRLQKIINSTFSKANVWNVCGDFFCRTHNRPDPRRVAKDACRRGVQPDQCEGRIIFMSMYNK